MDQGVLELFLREVDRQTQFALMAATDLRDALSRDQPDRIWYSIQSLLIGTANVSKLLWSAERGDKLRQLVEVEDDSPLASRKLRNHFEHFDERLEKWGVSPDTHMIVDSNIGPIGSIKGGASFFYVRNFDPSTETLTFHGELYELRRVITALEHLRSVTKRLLEHR